MGHTAARQRPPRMRVRIASTAGSGRAAENEDAADASPHAGWALVLDGATPTRRTPTGCHHGVVWLVARLRRHLRHRLDACTPATYLCLTEVLATAISATRADHAHTCDLDHPDAPTATLALARHSDAGLDYLVLGDTVALIPGAHGSVTVRSDDRVERLPGGRPYTRQLVRDHRNVPGGFWVAGSDPRAAHAALRGTLPTAGPHFALLTDGAARLATHYGHTWSSIWHDLLDHGPADTVERVRAHEHHAPPPTGKRHDDATVLYAAPASASTRHPTATR